MSSKKKPVIEGEEIKEVKKTSKDLPVNSDLAELGYKSALDKLD